MFLEQVVEKAEDPVLGLTRRFHSSLNSHKVNLGVGIFLEEDGRPAVFEAVRIAEKEIDFQRFGKEYQPILGSPNFLSLASRLIFPAISDADGYGACQTLGGTGALWIALSLVKEANFGPLVLFEPTWPNHRLMAKEEELSFLTLPYFGNAPFPLSEIERLPEGALLLLQTACHNPLGKDPSHEDWESLFSLMRKKRLYPLFDNAYQGLGKGFVEDGYPIHSWFSKGGEGFVATSFSKNMGLYGERAGLFSFFVRNKALADRVLSSISVRIRTCYSNPPLHPPRIIEKILSNLRLQDLWEKELAEKRVRLHFLRATLQEALGDLLDVSGHGLFTTFPFSRDIIKRLYDEEGIVMMENGRINLTGLCKENFNRVMERLCREIEAVKG